MIIVWHGHACFTLASEQGTLAIDPFVDHYVPGLSPIRLHADQVVCSHEHRDHCARDLVRISGCEPTYQLETISTFHDGEEGSLRGTNTIHVITADGLRVAHLGDLGCPLTGEQAARLQDLDALLIPVGGHYTIDAAQAQDIVEQLKPRVVIPMHYRSDSFGYDVLAPLSDFTSLRRDTVYYGGNRFVLTPNTPAQTAVLTYQPQTI